MMKKSTCAALFISSLFFVTATAAPAFADPGIYDWPDAEVPVLVQNKHGVIFLSNKKEPWRAYTWKQNNKGEGFKSFYAVDLNKDGQPEVVGVGKPVFLLAANSDPMWQLEKGCKQTMIADFVSDKSLDIACSDGEDIKVYTFDGQFAWKSSPGKRFEACRVGDQSGDLKADFECKYRGSKSWVLIDSSGKVLVQSKETPDIEEAGADIGALKPVELKSLSGKVSVDGNSLVIGSKAADKSATRVKLDGKATSVLVKDLDKDGKNEIVALTAKSIYVMDAKGANLKKFSASAKRYKRKPLAKFESVYSNYFADNDKAAEAVRTQQDALSKCYARRVRESQFAGIGRLILKVSVDHEGALKSVETVHSGINDKKIVACAQKALKKGTYPKAESEDALGTINVNMEYTYRDK